LQPIKKLIIFKVPNIKTKDMKHFKHCTLEGLRKELTPAYTKWLAKEMLANPYKNYYLSIDLAGSTRLLSAYPGEQPVEELLPLFRAATIRVATPSILAGWSDPDLLGAALRRCLIDWLDGMDI